MKFLYKLTDGEFDQSFAIKVAEMIGLKKEVLEDAKQKAEDFQNSAGLNEITQINREFNDIINDLSMW